MEKKIISYNRIHEYHSMNRFEMLEIHGTNVKKKNGNDDRVSSKRMPQNAHFHRTHNEFENMTKIEHTKKSFHILYVIL